MSEMSVDHLSTDDANSADGEGVWSPEIEQSFQEALIQFPPCGRRKHILQEEGGGRMYGRNELIARYIMLQTGKSRTRKQVSSHIQVLARRRAKGDVTSGGSPSSATPSPSSLSRSQSLSSSQLSSLSKAGIQDHHERAAQHHLAGFYGGIWFDRHIATHKIRLVEFSAYVDHRNPQPPGASALISSISGAPLHLNPSLLPPANGLAPSISVDSAADQLLLSHLQQQQQQQLQAAAYTNNHHLSQHHPLATNHNHHNHHPHQHPLPPNHHNHANQHHLLSAANSSSSFADSNQAYLATSQHNNNGDSQKQPNNHSLIDPSTGLTRHSYIKIDYNQPASRQTNKLERIDISQIQDKFHGIGGPEGLFQSCPDAFFLVKFWADMNEYNIEDQNSYFAFSSHFETVEHYEYITSTARVMSHGEQVLYKVDKICSNPNSSTGRYTYDMSRSLMCEFMITFIKKLRLLSNTAMNIVLENFTVLQVITSENTDETLLCMAYVFEVAPRDHYNGPQYHVYKLTKS